MDGSYHTWKISRYAFFAMAFCISFCWYWFPDFIFPALSFFSFPCWVTPQNKVVNQIFGMSSGLGLLPITFDCKCHCLTSWLPCSQGSRESDILCGIPLAHSLVGNSQCLYFSGLLNLGCGCRLLLYQCVEHRLSPVPELPRCTSFVQAPGATRSDRLEQCLTILAILTKSERLSMWLQATSSMSRNTSTTHRYAAFSLMNYIGIRLT